MQIYRVYGELDYTVRHCECPDCMGHRQSHRIDKIIESTSPEAALLHALPYDYDEDDYAKYLTVEEAAADREVYKQAGIVNILLQSGYGYNTRAPFVEMVIHAADWSTQMPPEQARDLAFNLLASADAADSDAFLMGFLRDYVGVTEPAALAGVLGQFRDYRAEYARGNSAERRNSESIG